MLIINILVVQTVDSLHHSKTDMSFMWKSIAAWLWIFGAKCLCGTIQRNFFWTPTLIICQGKERRKKKRKKFPARPKHFFWFCVYFRFLKTHFCPQGTHFPSQLVLTLWPSFIWSSSKHLSPSWHWDLSHLKRWRKKLRREILRLTSHHREIHKGGKCSRSSFWPESPPVLSD